MWNTITDQREGLVEEISGLKSRKLTMNFGEIEYKRYTTNQETEQTLVGTKKKNERTGKQKN